MARRAVIVLVLLGAALATGGPARGGSRETAESAFGEGIRLYESRRYSDALSSWRRVLEEGYGSAALFMNLGNAAYRTGELGWAVYYFEQARRRAPNDPDIAANLALARREALGLEGHARGSRLLDRFAGIQNRWTLAGAVRTGVALLWIAAGLVLASWIGRGRRFRRLLTGSATALALLALLLIGVKALQSTLAPEALAVHGITARSEPSSEATVEFRLPAGSPLGLGRTAPGWREVVVSTSLRGWVPAEDLALFGEPR